MREFEYLEGVTYMAIYRSIRHVRKVGLALYLGIPKLAQLNLRLFKDDQVVMDLDTETHTITIRPFDIRAVAPTAPFAERTMRLIAPGTEAPPALVDDQRAEEPLKAVNE